MRSVFLVALLVVLGGLAPAEEPRRVAEHPAAEFFSGRRAAVAQKLDRGVLLLRAAEPTSRAERYRQAASFYHMTGIEEPHWILALGADGEEMLFGPKSRLADMRGQGWPRVHPLDELEAKVRAKVSPGDPIWVDRTPEEIGAQNVDVHSDVIRQRRADPWDGRSGRAEAFEERLAKAFPGVRLRDAAARLHAVRLVKTEEEIERIREACRITAAGIREAVQECRPRLYEYELAALSEAIYGLEGARTLAFATICAGGANALTLHYQENDDPLRDGDLVLLDTGCAYGYYASDVTRTWAVGGAFTARQREIYEVVLAAQEAGIAAARPGATLFTIDDAAKKVIVQAGWKKGLRHFTCHFVGLSVHDVGSAVTPLAPGMVLAVEPGIYVDGEGIGVRIEDTVLITETGCEVLSAGAPKLVKELERNR